MATGTSGDKRDDELTGSTSGAVDAEPTDETESASEVVDDPGADSNEAATAGAAAKTAVVDQRKKSGKTAKRSEAEAAAKQPKQSALARFFGEVMAELRKVVTPTRKELWRYVAVVLGFLIIVMALVALFDLVFNFLASWTFGQGTELFPQPAEAPPTE